MLATEHNDTVHLLLATPPEWLRPGMVNRLDRLHTPGGPLSLTLTVSPDGRSAQLQLSPPAAGEVLLHTASLAAAGFHLPGRPATAAPLPVRPGEPLTLTFSR
jgi:hypothetical protein